MIKKTIRFIASPILGAGRVISGDIQGARSRLQTLLNRYTENPSNNAQDDFQHACDEIKRKRNMTDEQLRLHLEGLASRLRLKSRILYCTMLLGSGYAAYLAWNGIVLAAMSVIVWAVIVGTVAARFAMRVRQIKSATLFSVAKFIDDGKFFV